MAQNTGLSDPSDGLAYQFCSVCGTELEVKTLRLSKYPAQVSVYLACPSRKGFIRWIFGGPAHDEVFVGTRPVVTPYNPYTGERNKK